MKIRFVILLTLFSIYGVCAWSHEDKLPKPSYNHDKWGTSENGCIIRDFEAYRSCFDSADDNNGDETGDAWGIPKWVAYEIKKYTGDCIPTGGRPTKWMTSDDLFSKGIMPKDESYAYPSKFRNKHQSWFARGHLAMKMHAERLGKDAAWFTHTFYNAVPQRQLFNAGIWLDLENLTAAWAQQYGSVWIIDGPIFVDRDPYAYLGEKGEFPVAIPEALFKIVIKESARPNRPDILAFIYPQIGPGYTYKPYNHLSYLTTLSEIEKLTGITFFKSIASDINIIKSSKALELWPYSEKNVIRACSENSSYD